MTRYIRLQIVTDTDPSKCSEECTHLRTHHDEYGNHLASVCDVFHAEIDCDGIGRDARHPACIAAEETLS